MSLDPADVSIMHTQQQHRSSNTAAMDAGYHRRCLQPMSNKMTASILPEPCCSSTTSIAVRQQWSLFRLVSCSMLRWWWLALLAWAINQKVSGDATAHACCAPSIFPTHQPNCIVTRPTCLAEVCWVCRWCVAGHRCLSAPRVSSCVGSDGRGWSSRRAGRQQLATHQHTSPASSTSCRSWPARSSAESGSPAWSRCGRACEAQARTGHAAGEKVQPCECSESRRRCRHALGRSILALSKCNDAWKHLDTRSLRLVTS